MTPQLRFPEFTDEWQVKKLGDVLSIGSGRDYKHLKDGNIPVYGTGGLMTHVNDYLYDGKSVAIGRKGTIDQPQFLKGQFWTVDTLFYTHDYKNSIPEFIFLLFQNINWKKWNEASGVPSLSSSTIKSIKVNIPSKPEQEKIADFLTAVDERIAVGEKKLELLETYKRGVMQKIFSQQIRFKDENGNEYPVWEEKKLGEVASILKGQQLNGDLLSKHGKYPMLNGGISPSGFTDDFNKDEDTVTISEGGNSCGFVSYMREKFWSGGHLYTLENLSVDDKFLFQTLKYMQGDIMRLRVGSGLPNIQKGDLLKLKLLMPCRGEQQKIATFLTALDDKITAEKSKLTATKQFKKALLQRMVV